MKLLSWLLTLAILLVALCFALNNQQSITLSLWPFGVEMVAPLYLLTLGTLLLGLLIGAVIGWISHIPHRLETRRLRRDIEGLRGKIDDLQQTSVTQGVSETLPPPRSGWRFWERQS